jgi:hypothetical protein
MGSQWEEGRALMVLDLLFNCWGSGDMGFIVSLLAKFG